VARLNARSGARSPHDAARRVIATPDGIDYMEFVSAQWLSAITVQLISLRHQRGLDADSRRRFTAQVRNDLRHERTADVIELERPDNHSRGKKISFGFSSTESDLIKSTDYMTRVVQPI